MRVTGAGRLVAEATTTLRQVLAVTVPSGWLLPALPDDAGITVGAAIATDQPGLNHAGAGSFGHHVRRLDLRIAGGRVLRLSPSQDPDAFWATIGGIGLTGQIVRAELQLRRLTTTTMLRTRQRTGSLADTLDRFGEAAAGQWHDPDLHVVARLDPWAPEGRLGRALLETYRPVHPTRTATTAAGRPRPAAWSALRWSRDDTPLADLVPLATALYPPRTIRLRPMVRYECAVPENRAWLLADLLRMLKRSDAMPVRAVLTRFGPANPGALSFARPGWALALELPARRAGLVPTLTTADLMLARYGGRTRATTPTGSGSDSGLASMYPRLEAWQSVRERLERRGLTLV
jgi:decaprenylphospho-beta-D-ribofuranose 2-oxidase